MKLRLTEPKQVTVSKHARFSIMRHKSSLKSESQPALKSKITQNL